MVIYLIRCTADFDPVSFLVSGINQPNIWRHVHGYEAGMTMVLGGESGVGR
jgi:hypothetical protein